MFHFPEISEQPLFTGFKADDFTTMDKPTRYGKNNHFTYAEQPTVVGQGSKRKIEVKMIVPFAHENLTYILQRCGFQLNDV